MKHWSKAHRVAALAGGMAFLAAGFFAFVRPWLLDWGATMDERQRALPGDQIVPNGTSQTRAIDIAAPPSRVWPWLTQIGQDRGGFYSYEVLEDLVGCQMTNVYHLDAALQHWQLGDKQWMFPPQKLRGIGHNVLLVLEPGRALGFGTHQIGTPVTAPPDGSWSYVVEPVGPAASRLIIRGRGAGGYNVLAAALVAGLFDPIHFVMERKTMVTIRALAEGQSPPSRAADAWQVCLWAVTFAVMVASAALLLAGRRPARRLGTMMGAGVVFQVLTLGQPPPLLGTALVLSLLVALWKPSLGRRGTEASKGANVSPSMVGGDETAPSSR